jgi:heptosyltransferase I
LRVLIVKLSSLGDVVHTMPVVHDIRAAQPAAVVDWVVEPAFAPLVRRVNGIGEVIECAERRWREGWLSAPVRKEFAAFRERLRRDSYDAVIDLQGLMKSAMVAKIARGLRFGIGNATEGSSYEPMSRWLLDHPIPVEKRIHAMDRARAVVAGVFRTPASGAPVYGLKAAHPAPRADQPTVLFVHGTSRDDKLWPVPYWIQLGKRFLGIGWRIVLPQSNEAEQTRAEMIAAALQFEKAPQVEVWPSLGLGAVLDRMAGVQSVVGVDSGLSHVAVALDLPHVQIYNHPTSWRTGPQPGHGHRHQVSVEGQPTPTVDAVWNEWRRVYAAKHGG